MLVALELKEQRKGRRLHSRVFHQHLGRFVQGLLEDVLGKRLGDQRDLQVALIAIVGHGHIVGDVVSVKGRGLALRRQIEIDRAGDGHRRAKGHGPVLPHGQRGIVDIGEAEFYLVCRIGRHIHTSISKIDS